MKGQQGKRVLMMSKYEYKKEERKDERLNISIIFVDALDYIVTH